MDKIKKLERKYNEVSKIKDSVSTAEATDSERKVHIESTLNVFHRSEQADLEAKLQSIFTFLFNIEDDSYQIHQPELFDEEERELLLTHKERFVRSILSAKDDAILPLATKIANEEKSYVDFGQSLLQAFAEPKVPNENNIKLMDLEMERTKLIEKISELK